MVDKENTLYEVGNCRVEPERQKIELAIPLNMFLNSFNSCNLSSSKLPKHFVPALRLTRFCVRSQVRFDVNSTFDLPQQYV